MTRRHRHKTAARRLRSLYLWHRWIGLLAAAFVIVLALTGLALNHTEEMSLDDTYVQSVALLDWYGIHAPDDITTHMAGVRAVSGIGRRIFLDTSPLAGVEPPLAGAVESGEFIIVAVTDGLLLLTRDGEPVELLGSAAGVPSDIRSIGKSGDGRLILKTGEDLYITDEELINWQRTGMTAVEWSRPVTTPPGLTEALQRTYRGTGLSMERVMLDLHSGRIFGPWGVYLMDAAALVFVLLAGSGMWLWGRRRASARAHRRRTGKHGQHPAA